MMGPPHGQMACVIDGSGRPHDVGVHRGFLFKENFDGDGAGASALGRA